MYVDGRQLPYGMKPAGAFNTRSFPMKAPEDGASGRAGDMSVLYGETRAVNP